MTAPQEFFANTDLNRPGVEHPQLLVYLASLVVGVCAGVFILVQWRIFHPLGAVLIGATLLVCVIRFRPPRPVIIHWLRLVGWLALLALHLFLRLPAYPQPEGGQDQGVYYNWSAFHLRSADNRICDELAGRLTDDALAMYRDGGGFEMPAIAPIDEEGPCFRMELYPLQPLLLATFGYFLGAENRLAALAFFSVLMLAAGHRLALEITGGDRRAGAWAALLLAVNPGLAFLARVPFSENAALAFSLTSFALLARAWNEAQRGRPFATELFLSVASFGCYALCRSSSVLMAPALAGGVLIIAAYVHRPGIRRAFVSAIVVDLALIVSSLAYFASVMPHTFGPMLKRQLFGRESAAVLVAVLFLLALLACSMGRRSRLLRRLRAAAFDRRWIALLLLTAAAIALHVPFLLRVLFGDGVAYAIYEIPAGSAGVLRAQLVRAAIYLSPFGVAVLGYGALAARRAVNPGIGFLWTLVVSMVGMMAIGRVVWSPYSFYYDRYVLGDLVPYAIILVAVIGVCGARVRTPAIRRTATATLVLMASWSLVGASVLLGRTEGGDERLFDRIATYQDGETLLILETDFIWHHEAILTGLRVGKGLQVFPLRSIQFIEDSTMNQFASQFNRIVAVSGRSGLGMTGWRMLELIERRRAFFSDSSEHMLERMTAPPPRGSRTVDRMLPTVVQPWFPPSAHTVSKEQLYVYEYNQNGRVVSLETASFEAEAMLSAAEALGDSTVIESPETTSAGQARRMLPGYVESEETPMAAVYGPYVPMPAGCFVVEVRLKTDGSSDSRLAVLDVADTRGDRVFVRKEVVSSDLAPAGNYRSIPLSFSLAQPSEDVEFRVWYYGGQPLWIDKITVGHCAEESVD